MISFFFKKKVKVLSCWNVAVLYRRDTAAWMSHLALAKLHVRTSKRVTEHPIALSLKDVSTTLALESITNPGWASRVREVKIKLWQWHGKFGTRILAYTFRRPLFLFLAGGNGKRHFASMYIVAWMQDSKNISFFACPHRDKEKSDRISTTHDNIHIKLAQIPVYVVGTLLQPPFSKRFYLFPAQCAVPKSHKASHTENTPCGHYSGRRKEQEFWTIHMNRDGNR